jgi:hypothetical protein
MKSWNGILQFGVHKFSKCAVGNYEFFINQEVHLLQKNNYFIVNHTSNTTPRVQFRVFHGDEYSLKEAIISQQHALFIF